MQIVWYSTFSCPLNNATQLAILRANTHTVPDHIEDHVATIFGLNELPTRKAIRQSPGVTPSVLIITHSIGGVTIDHASKNSQAVAEFEGQTIGNKDLTAFFSKYVKHCKNGQDDVVSKFVGDSDKQQGETEASLDIQYIMGITPGIKTEFGLENNQDFRAGLVRWSNLILSTADAHNVHSVSYGWQGDLKQIQCEDTKVSIVDGNFAKPAGCQGSLNHLCFK